MMPPMMNEIFTNLHYEIRRVLGLRQSDYADLVGVSQMSVRRWEHGKPEAGFGNTRDADLAREAIGRVRAGLVEVSCFRLVALALVRSRAFALGAALVGAAALSESEKFRLHSELVGVVKSPRLGGNPDAPDGRIEALRALAALDGNDSAIPISVRRNRARKAYRRRSVAA